MCMLCVCFQHIGPLILTFALFFSIKIQVGMR